MMLRFSSIIVALLVVIAGFLGAFRLVTTRGTNKPAPVTLVATTTDSPSLLSGNASCSAGGCHGNVTPNRKSQEIWGNECRVWLERDPHSQAYLVLLDDSARQMAAPFGISEPHKAKECLDCHAPDVAPSTDLTKLVLPTAIGCETCHGTATKWLALHYEPEWQKKTAAEKSALGMTNTKDLLVRARLCTGCHVGAAGQDVNHDLIAAGHPQLNFEFTSYLAMLPKHWDEQAKDPNQPATYDPAFEVRAWAVGQAVSAGAAFDLFVDRATKRNPWPEFAEFDCAACHHNLQFPSWRQTEVYPRQFKSPLKLGSPRWGTWYFTMPRLLGGGRTKLPRFDSAVLDRIAPTLFDADMVAPERVAQIKELRLGLNQWAEALNQEKKFNVAELSRFLSDAAGDEEQLAFTNWDGGVQLYLALLAMCQAKLDGQQAAGQPLSPEEQQVLDECESILKSLHHYHDFRPSEFRDSLHRLRSELAE